MYVFSAPPMVCVMEIPGYLVFEVVRHKNPTRLDHQSVLKKHLSKVFEPAMFYVVLRNKLLEGCIDGWVLGLLFSQEVFPVVWALYFEYLNLINVVFEEFPLFGIRGFFARFYATESIWSRYFFSWFVNELIIILFEFENPPGKLVSWILLLPEPFEWFMVRN